MKGKVLNYFKVNVKWLLVGIILILSGYVIMGWNQGGTLSYDARVFAFHKITLAPIILIMGYVVIGLSIMLPSKQKEK